MLQRLFRKKMVDQDKFAAGPYVAIWIGHHTTDEQLDDYLFNGRFSEEYRFRLNDRQLPECHVEPSPKTLRELVHGFSRYERFQDEFLARAVELGIAEPVPSWSSISWFTRPTGCPWLGIQRQYSWATFGLSDSTEFGSLRRNALVMANQATGVFGDEALPILELVRRHRPLTEVEAVLCPECGTAIRVWFNSEGTVFGFHCTAEWGWAHYSRPERLASAPWWWRERIADTEPITFYWPTMSEIAPDGTITMRATGYDEGSHWTGVRHFTRDTSEYRFWLWVVGHRSRWPQFFSDRDLPRLREEFTNAV